MSETAGSPSPGIVTDSAGRESDALAEDLGAGSGADVALTTSPSGWYSLPPVDSLSGDPATRYKLSWFAERDTNYNALAPSETIGLFILEATALPGISRALFRGDLSREEAFAPYDHWDLSPWQTAGKAAAGLDRQFEAMGTTPLQKAFFCGMAINLRHLANLP